VEFPAEQAGHSEVPSDGPRVGPLLPVANLPLPDECVDAVMLLNAFETSTIITAPYGRLSEFCAQVV
jgi:hypothetical protein